ncbi:MAG: hypothetical protein M3416_04370 [Acidobacteriota bacterium]|nr:hypothetical protein [Acidobacteriota bacterium]
MRGTIPRPREESKRDGIVEPTTATATVPPADGRRPGEFAVPVTLPRRDATPEEHADALLAGLGFDAADLARYKERTGVDLRQHFIDNFRRAPRRSHNHYANGRGGFTAYVPIDRKWYNELRQFAGGDTAATPNGVKYNQVISITGANGRRIEVTFAWIRNNEGVVRLVTSIPAKK